MSALLSIRSVGKSFGAQRVLRDVSLEVDNGEFLTILGESGSGKTTLLRLIAGFEFLDSGEIHMDGQRLDRLPPYQRPVNTVFQQYALFPHMNVLGNVAYGLRIGKLPKEEVERRATEALALVKMSSFASAQPTTLSGGQQQRVALARALVNRPKLLLLDEPLSALDANLRRQMQSELKALQREVGISFILVTHDQEEAMSMSDRIALLRAGELEQVATPQVIYSLPASAYVARFIGQTNLIHAKVVNRQARAGALAWSSTAPDGDHTFSLRPECIRLESSGPQNGSARVRARVLDQSFHGATCLVQLECGDVRLTARFPASNVLSATPGAECSIEFDPADAVIVRDTQESD